MNIKSKQGDEVRAKILEFLKKREVKISPVSIQEICDELGISSTSVTIYHLGVLEKEGKVKRDKVISRHIEVIE